MKIKAKTKHGLPVTIVGFVCRYNTTYAVVVGQNGRMDDFPLDSLTVVDEL